jgi:hypothetical protein
MAIDLSALSSITTTATALSNLLLVTPNKNIGYQPTDSDGFSLGDSILFNYEGEQVATLTSDITDHYVEDNTSIQDNISLKPEEITTQGFIGELSDFEPGLVGELKRVAQEKLIILSAYTPAVSTTALLAINEAQLIANVARNVSNSVNSWKSLNSSESRIVNGVLVKTDSSNQTKQQIAFQQFYGYWRSRTLFRIQTPWCIFENMAIKSLRAVQDAETRMISDFEVTFKSMRFSSTIRTSKDANRQQLQSSNTISTTSRTGADVNFPIG